MFKFRRALVAALAVGATAPGLAVVAASPASAAPAPYTIALITSETGPRLHRTSVPPRRLRPGSTCRTPVVE